MKASLSIRQQLEFPRFHEQTKSRLVIGCWLTVLFLALGISLVTGEESFHQAATLTDPMIDNPERLRQGLADLGISPRTLAIISSTGYFLTNILSVSLSALLLLKRRRTDWFAFWISLVFVASIGAIYPPSLHQLVDGNPFWLVVGKGLTALAVIGGIFLMPFLFPDGHFVPRWMALVGIYILIGGLSFIIAPSWQANVPRAVVLLDLFTLLLALYSLVYRYRRKATPVQRQQMKWGLFGLAIALPAFLIGDALIQRIDGTPRGALALVGFTVVMPLANAVFPICLAIAILRYRLYDIDVILNRTLVWGAMTALVVAGYAAIVLGIGSLIGGDRGTLLSLIATGLVAVAFQPVRQRVQRVVNRLLYGDRDDPYRVLSQLGTRLEETLAPGETLRTTVRTLTDALRLPYAAIALHPNVSPVAASGEPTATLFRFPLVYQSEPVGELVVSPRPGGERFNAADQRLLEDLARQIGVVAHGVKLTEDLQRSRERLVTAREEERRRLRRDLHDGLGAQLSALTLQAGAIRAMLKKDPESAGEQAAELQTELRSAVADIRRLVHGLRPPALDELGLPGALRAKATRMVGLNVVVDLPEELPKLSAATEVAIYRIVDEALTNVVRHANASCCAIRLESGDELTLTIQDNGTGIPADRATGVGLISMQERAQELGGTFTIKPADPTGTRIVVYLSLNAAEPIVRD